MSHYSVTEVIQMDNNVEKVGKTHYATTDCLGSK